MSNYDEFAIIKILGTTLGVGMDNTQIFVLGGTVVTFAILIGGIYLAKQQSKDDD